MLITNYKGQCHGPTEELSEGKDYLLKSDSSATVVFMTIGRSFVTSQDGRVRLSVAVQNRSGWIPITSWYRRCNLPVAVRNSQHLFDGSQGLML